MKEQIIEGLDAGVKNAVRLDIAYCTIFVFVLTILLHVLVVLIAPRSPGPPVLEDTRYLNLVAIVISSVTISYFLFYSIQWRGRMTGQFFVDPSSQSVNFENSFRKKQIAFNDIHELRVGRVSFLAALSPKLRNYCVVIMLYGNKELPRGIALKILPKTQLREFLARFPVKVPVAVFEKID